MLLSRQSGTGQSDCVLPCLCSRHRARYQALRLMAAGAAITGGEITVEGCGSESVQGDVRFAEVMGLMGARVEWEPNSITIKGAFAPSWLSCMLCSASVSMQCVVQSWLIWDSSGPASRRAVSLSAWSTAAIHVVTDAACVHAMQVHCEGSCGALTTIAMTSLMRP